MKRGLNLYLTNHANNLWRNYCEGSVGQIKSFIGPHVVPGPQFAHFWGIVNARNEGSWFKFMFLLFGWMTGAVEFLSASPGQFIEVQRHEDSTEI